MSIRFGIFGCRRGGDLVGNIIDAGGEVVALCDRDDSMMDGIAARYPAAAGAAKYHDFDTFIAHDMDAVLLANAFSEHVDFAVRALEAGKHVISETTANVCMADGVRLCRAVERTGKVYSLFENYPLMCRCLEMERLYKSGQLGKVVYAEGEYVHPMTADEQNFLSPGRLHWRNWTPRCFYTTHALAPLMRMTDTMPKKVTAMASYAPEVAKGTALNTGDAAAILLLQMDNDAVFSVNGWSCFYPHGNHYRICGTKGGVVGFDNSEEITVSWRPGAKPESAPADEVSYRPVWANDEMGRKAATAGHGGGDFLMFWEFIRCLENGEEPYWNVYRATALSSAAILGWRAVLEGKTYEIPDLRDEEQRKLYENDFVSPYPDAAGVSGVRACSKPYAPTEEDFAAAQATWDDPPKL